MPTDDVYHDGQRPSSSKAFAPKYMGPASSYSNLAPQSPYGPSPGPLSNHQPMPPFSHPGSHGQEFTSSWVQNYHNSSESMYGSGEHHQSAPSVMSNATHLTGMSRISVNTQATLASCHNGYNPYHSGPLSSNSLSENVDPLRQNDQLSESVPTLLRMLQDTDPDVHAKAATLLYTLCKQRLADLNEELLKWIMKTVSEQLWKQSATQVKLVDLLSCLANHAEAVKVVLDDSEDGSSIIAGFRNFFALDNVMSQRVSPSVMKRLLVLLNILLSKANPLMQPMLIRSLRIEGVFCTAIKLAYDTLQYVEKTGGHCPVEMYQGTMRNTMYYLNVVRILIRSSVEAYRMYCFKQKIFDIVLGIVRLNIRYGPSLQPAFVQPMCSVIAATIKNMLSTTCDEIINAFLHSGGFDLLLISVCRFNHCLHHSTIQAIFTSISYVTDKKMFAQSSMTLSIQQPVALVIHAEISRAIEENHPGVVKAVLDAEVNISRNPEYQQQLITHRFHNRIFMILKNSVTQWLRQSNDKESAKFREFVDNCLWIIKNLAFGNEQCALEMMNQFFQSEIVEAVMAVVRMNNDQLRLQILKIWNRFALINGNYFNYYNSQAGVNIFSVLLDIITCYWDDAKSVNIVVLALETYANVSKWLKQGLQQVRDAELLARLNQQANVKIISTVMATVFICWENDTAKEPQFSEELKTCLERFNVSSNCELANQARGYLDKMANDIPSLSEAFNPAYL